MRVRNAAGLALIAAVLAIGGWFVAVSPSAQEAQRKAVGNRPPVIACTWSQPWIDPAFVMSGWSRPQAWWHQPDTKVLWSNARASDVVFRIPLADSSAGWEVAVSYVAVSAPVEVWINGRDAGALDANAKGNHDPHLFHYQLATPPAGGIVDIRFLTPHAVLHANDGRYLGILLDAIRACPTGTEQEPD